MKLKNLNRLAYLCLLLVLVASTARAEDVKDYSRGLSHYIAAVYQEDLGDIDEAVREYRKAIDADKESYLLHLNLASAYIKKNDLASAVAELKLSVGLAPEAVEPRAILALVYASQDKADLAAREYERALENAVKLDPDNTDIYKNLGAVYLQERKLKEAEGVFKLVAGMDPLDAEAHFCLGSIYYQIKDYPSAEKELKTAIRLNPDYHEALNFLGYFYLEQNRNINKAGAMIKKALVLQPENGAYIDSLGWFYFKKGRFKQALEYLEQSAAQLSDPVIYDHLGDTFLKLGNCEEAKNNWEKSLKLDPGQETVKNKLFEVCQE
ncbi:MAG: tetratricopeptide repeat protein [Candidatus Omnitrophica bacterium]|nr:tetratricopeptide repeat protein [Candidatus Omnitrophota bacterium]MDD5042290.1 tetratricopeptide repeat protein [Candidatus Omnitrophota bacterium]MDD5500145.1 tetratricopeptide repeat protein [Candidatus Omnitrophota bacterium]